MQIGIVGRLVETVSAVTAYPVHRHLPLQFLPGIVYDDKAAVIHRGGCPAVKVYLKFLQGDIEWQCLGAPVITIKCSYSFSVRAQMQGPLLPHEKCHERPHEYEDK